MRVNKTIIVVAVFLQCSACVHLDVTEDSVVTNKCLETKAPMNLLEHSCGFLCKTSYGITYSNIQEHRFLGQYEKIVYVLPVGTKIVIEKITKVAGVTDAEPFMLWGRIIDGKYSDIEFHIGFYGFFDFSENNDIKPNETSFSYCQLK